MSAHPSLSSVDAVTAALADHDYLADRGLATTIFLATSLNRPLLLSMRDRQYEGFCATLG